LKRLLELLEVVKIKSSLEFLLQVLKIYESVEQKQKIHEMPLSIT